MRAPVDASACAAVPPPAPLPMMTRSKPWRIGRGQAAPAAPAAAASAVAWIRSIRTLVGQRRLPGASAEDFRCGSRGRSRGTSPGSRGRRESPGSRTSGHARARPPHQNEPAVRLEGDDAVAPEQLRQAHPAQQRRHLARVVERAGRAVVVAEGGQHRLGARVRPGPRRRRPVAVDRRDPRPEAVRDVEPVDPLLEEGVAAGQRLVVPPVAGGLEPADQGREVGQDQFAYRPLRQQPAQADRQRLVVIVLPHQHDAAGAVSRLAHPARSRPAAGTPASPPARACRRPAPAGSDRDGTAAAPRRRRRPRADLQSPRGSRRGRRRRRSGRGTPRLCGCPGWRSSARSRPAAAADAGRGRR